MSSSKERVSVAILHARHALDEALGSLAGLPAYDPDVTGYVAHALNNFLTVSTATIELLNHSLDGHPDQEVHRLLEGLRHSTNLMSHVVRRLSSNDKKTDLGVRPLPIDVSMVARNAVDFYTRFASKKDLQLFADTTEHVPTIWTDGTAFAAILDNYLSNAVKYSEPGGKIVVRVRTDERAVLVSVIDQGPGLSGEEQGLLFQHPVRLSPRPTAEEPSHGYGLAIVKELADALGAAVGCDSEVGQGSTFWVRLPINQPADEVI